MDGRPGSPGAPDRSWPLVSICVPTYNHESFIGPALESAIGQDYPNLEVIVADDGSTDATMEVVVAIASRAPHVRVLASTPNQGLRGIVKNYNRCVAAARGEYVAFLEGDDCYLPGKIKTQVEWLEADRRRVLCGHDVEVFDSHSGTTRYRWSDRFPLRAGAGAAPVLRHRVPFCTVAVMVRRSSIPPGGFDDRLVAVLDWKFWIDCLIPGGDFGYVPGVLARYRRHETNITNQYRATRQDDLFVTVALVESRHPALADACRGARASLFYSRAIEHLVDGDAAAARRDFVNAIHHKRSDHVKARIGLALTLLPARVRAAVVSRWFRDDAVAAIASDANRA